MALLRNLFRRRADPPTTATLTETTLSPFDDVVDLESQPRPGQTYRQTVLNSQMLDVEDAVLYQPPVEADSTPAYTGRGQQRSAEDFAPATLPPLTVLTDVASDTLPTAAEHAGTVHGAPAAVATEPAVKPESTSAAALHAHPAAPSTDTPPAPAATLRAEPDTSAAAPMAASVLAAAAASAAAATAATTASRPGWFGKLSGARKASVGAPEAEPAAAPTPAHEPLSHAAEPPPLPEPPSKTARSHLTVVRPPKRSIAPPAEPEPEAEVVGLDQADEPDFAHTAMLDGPNRLLGDMLLQRGQLSTEQVDAVLDHQRQHKTRFGESAVALGYVQGDQVLHALSKQFGYDYAPPATPNSTRFSDELVIAKHPFSQAAETIRDLRTQLLTTALNPDLAQRRALALVSPNSGDGKTWFAANLAVSLSQLGARTLLIDANLRSPRLHSVFGLRSPRTGLSGIISRQHKVDLLRPYKALPYLYLLPAGATPPNPLEIVQGAGFVDLLLRLRGKFTHIIVDTPPLAAGADARVIAARCGASVLIGRRNVSSMSVLSEAARNLSKGDAQFAGLVLNEI